MLAGFSWLMDGAVGSKSDGSCVVLWRSVKARIEADIVARRYRRDEPLPSELLLAERYGVHRHTLRRAMAELENEGLVSVQQGRGTYIEAEALSYRIGGRVRFTENALLSGFEPEATLLGHATVRAGRQHAASLGVRPGSRLLLLRTLRRVAGRPVSYALHHFPPTIGGKAECTAEHLARLFEASHSVTAVLAELGVPDYRRTRTDISSRLPAPEEARILEIGAGQPIMIVAGANVDSRGEPILFTIGHMPTLRVQLYVESGPPEPESSRPRGSRTARRPSPERS